MKTALTALIWASACTFSLAQSGSTGQPAPSSRDAVLNPVQVTVQPDSGSGSVVSPDKNKLPPVNTGSSPTSLPSNGKNAGNKKEDISLPQGPRK
jgi:hypothetical protein